MAARAWPLDDEPRLPAPVRTRQEVGWWAMALVCATEAAFFAYLLMSYFYLAVRSPSWPPPGIADPRLQLPSIMTVLLVASSVVLYWGEKGIAQGRQLRLRIGLAVAVLLGAAFVTLQAIEYHRELREMPPRMHAYASIFYTTTGFHGAHVTFGLLLLLYTLARALLGHFGERSHLGVKVASLYWHFVDVVWLFIFTLLYLSPRWW
jgi:heme/copper-type cytochrome/quinol oxidase subunit 3